MRGEELQTWREAHGLSRRQLAQRLDVAEATIHRWEKNERRLPSRIIELALVELDRRLAAEQASKT
jgi:transcriptional regulator with XRE-family HTH domain